MKENMFIIDSNIRFRKPIPKKGYIQGTIELMKIKRHGDLYIAFLDYDLEQGKSKGKMELALKLKRKDGSCIEEVSPNPNVV